MAPGSAGRVPTVRRRRRFERPQAPHEAGAGCCWIIARCQRQLEYSSQRLWTGRLFAPGPHCDGHCIDCMVQCTRAQAPIPWNQRACKKSTAMLACANKERGSSWSWSSNTRLSNSIQINALLHFISFYLRAQCVLFCALVLFLCIPLIQCARCTHSPALPARSLRAMRLHYHLTLRAAPAATVSTNLTRSLALASCTRSNRQHQPNEVTCPCKLHQQQPSAPTQSDPKGSTPEPFREKKGRRWE